MSKAYREWRDGLSREDKTMCDSDMTWNAAIAHASKVLRDEAAKRDIDRKTARTNEVELMEEEAMNALNNAASRLERGE